MKLITCLLLALAVALSGCKTAAKRDKEKKAALDRKAKANLRGEEISDTDFQAFVGRLRKAVAAQFKAAGITPLSVGNVTMKNDPADIRRAFEYARDIGVPTIVCSPEPESMKILDAMVKEFDIKIAIHNHGPEDKKFPSPYDVWTAVQPYDKRVGLCIDVGHTARAKVDPAEAIRKCRERLYDCHLKDIDSTAPDGKTIEGGRGVLDLKSIFRALLDVHYPHLASFEYEKDENDPVPGLSETIGYAKGIVAGLA